MKISEAKRQVMLQQWTELIKEQKARGMKVNAWCKERGIGEGQFYYWQKQVRQTLLDSVYNLATGSMPRLYETVFPAWFSFYVLGLDCRSGKWVNVCRRAKNWWIAAVLGLSIIEAFVLLRAGCAIGFVSSQIRFGSFL